MNPAVSSFQHLTSSLRPSGVLGSLAEVEYLLGFAREERCCADKDYQAAESLRQETGRLLWSFYEAL